LQIDFGDKLGCVFNDVVYVPVSPDWLEDLKQTYIDKAMSAKQYDEQGWHRKKVDLFSSAFDEWRKRRDAKDDMK